MKCKLCKAECELNINATEFGCDVCTNIARDEGGYLLPYQRNGEATTPTHWDCECEEDWLHEKYISRICPKCRMGHYECTDSYIWDVYDFSDYARYIDSKIGVDK